MTPTIQEDALMKTTNQQDMGKVFTTLTIINRADQIFAEAGVKTEDCDRSSWRMS
jgi:hypothetical protein